MNFFDYSFLNVIFESFFFPFFFLFPALWLVGYRRKMNRRMNESSTLVCLNIYTLNPNLCLFQTSFCSRARFTLFIYLFIFQRSTVEIGKRWEQPRGWRADLSLPKCGSLPWPLPLSFLLRGRCSCFRALMNARTVNACGHQPVCKEAPSLFTARSY